MRSKMIKCPHCGSPNIVETPVVEIEMAFYYGTPLKMLCEHCKLESLLQVRIVAEKEKYHD
jgi:hypothetical protein